MHKNAKQNRKQENKVGLVSKNVILIKKINCPLIFEIKIIFGFIEKIGPNLAYGFL